MAELIASEICGVFKCSMLVSCTRLVLFCFYRRFLIFTIDFKVKLFLYINVVIVVFVIIIINILYCCCCCCCCRCYRYCSPILPHFLFLSNSVRIAKSNNMSSCCTLCYNMYSCCLFCSSGKKNIASMSVYTYLYKYKYFLYTVKD